MGTDLKSTPIFSCSHSLQRASFFGVTAWAYSMFATERAETPVLIHHVFVEIMDDLKASSLVKGWRNRSAERSWGHDFALCGTVIVNKGWCGRSSLDHDKLQGKRRGAER